MTHSDHRLQSFKPSCTALNPKWHPSLRIPTPRSSNRSPWRPTPTPPSLPPTSSRSNRYVSQDAFEFPKHPRFEFLKAHQMRSGFSNHALETSRCVNMLTKKYSKSSEPLPSTQARPVGYQQEEPMSLRGGRMSLGFSCCDGHCSFHKGCC